MEEDDFQHFVSSGSNGFSSLARSEGSSASSSPRMMMPRDSQSSPPLKRRASIVAARSFKSDGRESETKEVESRTFLGKVRKVIQFLVIHHYLGNFMGIVVVLDSFFTSYDIDSRAIGEETPQVIIILSDLCLALYTMDLFLNLFVHGTALMKDWMVILDTVIILCGYVEFIFTYFNVASDVASKITILRVLRMARIVRLMQLLRKTRSLKELQKLVTMMATCLKALAWSFLFTFVIMTVWAMLMVETIQPVIDRIQADDGIFDDCEQCTRACRSVMDANLLLFKTVIAGDSWGTIAVPVIEAQPLTAVIFVGSLLSLVFGVLNLIVAVVVDTFAEVRESDVMNLAEEMDHVQEMDKKFLQKIFDRIDVEKKGLLTLEDIMQGARVDAEFQSRLRVMDIDEVDLQQLFEMIDVDGSGAVEAEEFIVPLSRWVHDSKTAPRFIKYNLMHVMQQQQDLVAATDRYFVGLNNRISDLEESLEQKLEHRGKDPIPTTVNWNPATAGMFGMDSEAEVEVHQPHRSNSRYEASEVMKPAVDVLNQTLSEALRLSVVKMEAILQEELSKCFPPLPPAPSHIASETNPKESPAIPVDVPPDGALCTEPNLPSQKLAKLDPDKLRSERLRSV